MFLSQSTILAIASAADSLRSWSNWMWLPIREKTGKYVSSPILPVCWWRCRGDELSYPSVGRWSSIIIAIARYPLCLGGILVCLACTYPTYFWSYRGPIIYFPPMGKHFTLFLCISSHCVSVCTIFNISFVKLELVKLICIFRHNTRVTRDWSCLSGQDKSRYCSPNISIILLIFTSIPACIII